MADTNTSPGTRLHDVAAREYAGLRRDLMSARLGKDAAVHRARKALQRIRAVVRLMVEADPEWVRHTELRIKRLRRRLGRLRDAAVRVEQVRKTLADLPVGDDRVGVEAALERLREQLAEAWAALPERFWDNVDRDWARQVADFADWPIDRVDAAGIDAALDRARRQVRSRLRLSLGSTQRGCRHKLRCGLRRYAAMRRIAAQVLKRRDPTATRLVDFARELGGEGDLWLTALALRQAGHVSETRHLRGGLDKSRRALCKLHDGELAALQRGVLKLKHRRRPQRARGSG